MSEYCGAFVDNISHAPICALERKYRKPQNALKNMLNIFEGSCQVNFVYKVTTNDI